MENLGIYLKQIWLKYLTIQHHLLQVNLPTIMLTHKVVTLNLITFQRAATYRRISPTLKMSTDIVFTSEA